MAYNAEKAAQNKEKKRLEDLKEIEKDMGGVAVQEAPKVKAANEFESDYTLQVDSDYDPTADIFRIPKRDPSFEYRYLRDEKKRLSIATSSLLHQMGGWQLCPKRHLEKIGFKGRDISEDGFRRIGEHILAFMPMDFYLKKVAGKQRKTNARTAVIRRNINKGITRYGADGAVEEVRDEKQKDNKYYVPGDKNNSRQDQMLD